MRQIRVIRPFLRSALPAAALAAALSGAALPTAAASPAAPDPHRGGTLRLLAVSGAGTIDPQINYTVQFWQIFQGVYDGLVTFKKAPGEQGFVLVPDLAEALAKPENGGKRYTFKLRAGIRFSDGRAVTVADAAASMRRLFKVLSPTAGSFYNRIVGADACIKTPATCTLAGGVVADAKAGTLTINLTEPDPEFLQKLAAPHASILPADTPAHDVGVQPIAGTGAYRIVSYDPKRSLKLARNPAFKLWSDDAQPDGHVDAVDYDFGLPDTDQVTAIGNGQADWMFDPVPADRLGEVGTKFAAQVHLTPQTAIYYLPMNTRLPPFDKLQARQALNYALDRSALVKLFGGPRRATPSCQVLPPKFPGYQPYCPYTLNPGTAWSAPDLAKARQLVKASGTAGQKVTLITEDTAVGQQIATYVQSVLRDLGYDASVKVLSGNIEFTYIQNTNNKVQISYSQWYQDYPAASDFLNVLFSCASFHPGSDSSINISGLCDAPLDAAMAQAMATGLTDAAAADRQWAAIDKRVTDLAPAAVLFNPNHLDFTSKRLGNFAFSSQFQFLFNRAWVR